MVGIVETDRDELPGSHDRHAQSRRAIHQRELRRRDGGEFFQHGAGKILGRDIRNDTRQIAQSTLLVDEARLLGPVIPKSDKLHVRGQIPGASGLVLSPMYYRLTYISGM